ncbi:MAG: anaerobic ribonucleoside-triphosphate reductase [Promethearchaeati archaeon]
MGSDKKISETLEKQLKAIGQKIRLDLLKNLHLSDTALSFSDLQKSIMLSESNSVNLTFHLNSLKEAKLIWASKEGYHITDIGKQILEKVIDIEHIINKKNKNLVIRTSKYSTEPFNIKNVKEYLMREADMDPFLADQMAKLVEKRLSETNVEYLTAPLMREYINAILLEEGLEEFRHKLTRLGIPPYDAEKLFDMNSVEPMDYIKKLGSESSEQFLLLNLLPKKLADLYLSNKIALLNLNTWSLRPLSIFLNFETILNNSSQHIQDPSLDYTKSHNRALNIYYFLQGLAPFFSNNVLLYNFASLSSYIKNNADLTIFINTFLSLVRCLNKSFQSKHAFSLTNSKLQQDSQPSIFHRIVLELKDYLDKSNRTHNSFLNLMPQILIDYTSVDKKDIEYFFNSLFLKYGSPIFFDGTQSLINSDLISSSKEILSFPGEIVLDKVLINLYSIAQESNRNDSVFFEILNQRVNSVFSLYDYKKKFVERKLKNSSLWNKFLENFLNFNKNEWTLRSIKSISFLGLNEAVKSHCGIELDRIESSQKFAFKILNTMKEIITERNSLYNEKFCLSQPHQGSYLQSIDDGYNESIDLDINTENNLSLLIRKSSKLTLDEKIAIYRKFSKVIDGGFLVSVNDEYSEPKKAQQLFKTIMDSKLLAFNICYN